MIVKTLLRKKAIPALTVGIAFFLISCQPRIPSKRKVRGEESALALHRSGEIYSETGQYRKAVGLFKKIPEEYPDYAELSVVRYQIVRSLYLLGEYQRSKEEGLEWLEKYPRHSLKGDILLLLGESFKALGDSPRAFVWWLKAKEEYPGDLQRQGELNEKLEELINTSRIEEFEQLTGYAVERDYVPKVYHKMAVIFLEQNELEKARKAAMSLVRSTSEQPWVSLGRQLLERIQEEMSVRFGAVGCLLPLSGPFAIYGEEVLNGIQLGMGIFSGSGRDPVLELVIKDTKGTPEHAAAGLEDLVNNEKVMAVIGPLSSRAAVAAAKKAQGLGIPMIALTQKEGIIEEGDMVFRNFLTPSREVERLLDTAIRDMGLKRFGILYPDNSYGRFFMNLFWDRLEAMGGMVTAVESYNPDDTDFADHIQKMTGLFHPRPDSLVRKLREMRTPEEEESEIFSEEPEPVIDFDAVFIPDNFQRVSMIAPQLAYHDVLDVQLMGTSLWQSPRLVEMAGDYVQGAIFSSGFMDGSGEPGVDAFIDEYKANFDAAPGVLAATGYDTIRLLKEVMEEEDVRTRKDFHEALLWSRGFDGVTGTIFFDFQGEVGKEPLLLTISGRQISVFR